MVPNPRKNKIPLWALGRHGCAREKGGGHAEGTPVGTEVQSLKRTHDSQEDSEEEYKAGCEEEPLTSRRSRAPMGSAPVAYGALRGPIEPFLNLAGSL